MFILTHLQRAHPSDRLPLGRLGHVTMYSPTCTSINTGVSIVPPLELGDIALRYIIKVFVKK